MIPLAFLTTLTWLQLFALSSATSPPLVEQEVLTEPIPDSILKVRQELKKAEIIPSVIDDFMPFLTLQITWSKKISADLGNTLKPSKLQDAPSISINDKPASSNDFGSCNPNMTYTVAMTDPDAPSRDNPEWSEMCHWIATGFPLHNKDFRDCSGKALSSKMKEVKEVMPYKPPGPPEMTGKHRYVFLVFAPANGTSIPLNLTKPSDRQHWGTGEERHGVRDWAADNGLVPVGANFIYAQNKKQ